MNVRILRDRRGRPDLLDTTTARLLRLIEDWKGGCPSRRARIGALLARFGVHLTEATPRSKV